jgi:type III secretory pathway lipoprotein EscJ
MKDNWVKVFTTTNSIEAQIVLTMLRENGIDAVEMNKKDSSLQAFGNIDILVNEVDEADAITFLNNKN